jgi:hypothetical protein
MNGRLTKYKKNQNIKNEMHEKKEVKNEPTLHCQSNIMLSLSVRAEKMMDKKFRGAFHKHLSKAHRCPL